MRILSVTLAGILALCSCQSEKNSLAVPGLLDFVEVIRDSSGVNHIYAQNEHDLFFAQGIAQPRTVFFNSKSGGARPQALLLRFSGPEN